MRRIDKEWKGRLFQLAADNPDWRARRLHKALSEQFGEPPGFPSLKWVERSLPEIDALEPEERRSYASFRWPESMLVGALPWDAAEAALELLDSEPIRPSVRFAKWYWRVTLAAPKAAPGDLRLVARHLAALEAAGPIPESEARKAETWLRTGEGPVLEAIFDASNLPDEIRSQLPPEVLKRMKGDLE